MEWGEGRRTETPPQVQRRTERTQGREGEGKGAAISSCRRAQRQRQPERRPGCGGQYQPPPTPLSSVMKAEEGEKRNIPLPRRRQAPYHGVGGRRRSAVRQRLFPRMLGAARAPAAGREAARARAGRKRCRRHGRRARRRKRLLWWEPSVATPRTPPPTPPGSARTRVSACTRGGRGTHAPTGPPPTPPRVACPITGGAAG